MEKEIKIKQENIIADSNKGVSFNNVPARGTELPPINIDQKNIQAKENVGLEFNHNPNSGLVKMNHTIVEGDGTKVIINPDVGSVIINPAAGSVKFNYQK